MQERAHPVSRVQWLCAIDKEMKRFYDFKNIPSYLHLRMR